MSSIQGVGFDIGTLNCFVSYTTNQGLQTIHDDYGDRRIPTCICFIDGRRLVGMSAKMQHESARTKTVWNFTQLLGRRYESLTTDEERMLPFSCRETIGGRVGIEVAYLRRVWILIPEQLLAIQLQYLRSLTEKAMSDPIKSLVVNVPVFYTDAQKRAVRDAANIAGISPIRLITDTTAIATAYGFYKDGSLLAQDPPQHVAFVSIGYRSTQVAICAISKGTTRILATTYDEKLGGQNFDHIIFDHIRDYISQKYHIELECNGVAWHRLLKECEQLKIRMSASPNALPINLDGIAGVNGNRVTMARGEFEKLSEKLLARFRETILRCLSASKLQATDVQSVELVGGSCRIPVLRQIAGEIFNREATTTLNADEAVARGCAIHARMSSAGFEIRYRVIEPDVKREAKFPDIPCLISKELNDLRATEVYMSEQDRGHGQRSLARNTLEEYIYATKGRFEGQLKESVTTQERQLLDETESWISVGAAERSSDVYENRLKELRKVVSDVEKRHRMAKTVALSNAGVEEKALHILGVRPTKHEQVRRSVRHSLNAPISAYSPIYNTTQNVVSAAPKAIKPVEPVDVTPKSRSPQERSPELTPRMFVRSSTMDRTPVTGQLNCYSIQPRNLRSSMVNLIVNFFEKINDVNLQEAERSRSPRRSVSPGRSPPRHRTPTYSDYMLPDESINRGLQTPIFKGSPTEYYRHMAYSASPTADDYVALHGRTLEQKEIKAIPIMDTLSNGPQIPSYDTAVREASVDGRQDYLLDCIHDYRISIAIESRRLYEVFDRYKVSLERQLQKQHVASTPNLTENDKQKIEALLSEADKTMNEVRRHQTETAQHLSFMDNQRDTIMALTSDEGSQPKYTQQAYMRILTTFIQPIWMLFEEAKILRKALHEYEAWLLRENQDRVVYATGLSPVARMDNMLINHVRAYNDFIWDQVSCLHTQLHKSLEHINEQLEALAHEERPSIDGISLLSLPR